MWGVLSLVRQGLRRRRRRTARVVDESALGDGAAGHAGADVTTVFCDARAAAPRGPSALARALLAMACAVRLDGEDVGGADEAWTASGWRPRADEVSVSHLMVRESMRYAIYA